MLALSQIISLLLTALVTGVFWGPWVGLTISLRSFDEDTFLALVKRLNRNLGRVMTVLFPLALLSIIVVLVCSFERSRVVFHSSAAALMLFGLALAVTLVVEVPIVHRIASWTRATMPTNWQQQRDRWMRFHVVRLVAAVIGFILLASGAIIGR